MYSSERQDNVSAIIVLFSGVKVFDGKHKQQGLDGVKLIVGDKCLGMLEAVGEVFAEAKYQRCTIHFYRNVFSVTP